MPPSNLAAIDDGGIVAGDESSLSLCCRYRSFHGNSTTLSRRGGMLVCGRRPAIIEAYNVSQELGWKGIDLFNQALALAESPDVKARVEKASMSAYRLSLGNIWLGRPIEGMTEEDKVRYRESARRVLELCEQFKIISLHEGRRIEDLAPKMQKALGMEENEPF